MPRWVSINHNGDINIAKELIKMAKECGCDAVKFQKRDIPLVYDCEFLDSYRKSPWGDTQRKQKEGLEFNYNEYNTIWYCCQKEKIDLIVSPWDVHSIRFVRELNCPYNKIASAILGHVDIMDEIAMEGKHTFISTGMSSWDRIEEAIKLFEGYDCPYTLMACTSTYPTKNEDCNISLVKTLVDKYPNISIGYSGHEYGILPSILAVSLGATVIERHITLDRTMYGSDQSASLERPRLEKLVRDCRLVKTYLGDGDKRITPEEKVMAKKLRYYE